MRLKKNDLVTVYFRERTVTQDDESNETISWGESVALEMNVQSASGAVNATIYGTKLSSMKSCKYQGDLLKEGRDEGNGICLYVKGDETPDYRIKSIQPFSTHFNIMLERNDEHGR